MNENNPVLHAMRQELQELRGRYVLHPSDFNRYQLVRQEQRLAQWAPAEVVSV